MGFTQRQAAGKFTRDEAAAFIAQLLAGVRPLLGRPTTSSTRPRGEREAHGVNSSFSTRQVGQPQNLQEFEEQVLSKGVIAVQHRPHRSDGGREARFVRPPHREGRREITRWADLVQPLHGLADPTLVVLAQVDLWLAVLVLPPGNAV
jgi:hypothetical protein